MGFTQAEIDAAREEGIRDGYCRAYTGKLCLLNGKPARITRLENGFAKIVGTIEPFLDGGEWSWEAVHEVMKKGGQFGTL